MSKYFKLVLFVRFAGYLLFICGLLAFIAVLGPVVQAEFNYRWDKVLGVTHLVPTVITSDGTEVTESSFGNLDSPEGEIITPVSTEFGLVIEKINANAQVVANVNPASEREYTQALLQGVAHAAGTSNPGEIGNTYLFSHSTDAPWNIVRYNAIFYLLRELEPGDRILVFYQNKRYDYVVYDKVIADPNDVSYLTNRYDVPVLTLQTCDPPGTLFKRLIVRARLAGT